MEAVKSSRFGNSSRPDLGGSNSKALPGPGAHSPDPSPTIKSSPRFSLGTSKRGDLGRKTFAPGAGTYSIPGIVGKEGRAVSMHSLIKFDPQKVEDAKKPGPGNYQPDFTKTKKSEPKFGMGSSTRLDLEAKTMQSF